MVFSSNKNNLPRGGKRAAQHPKIRCEGHTDGDTMKTDMSEQMYT